MKMGMEGLSSRGKRHANRGRIIAAPPPQSVGWTAGSSHGPDSPRHGNQSLDAIRWVSHSERLQNRLTLGQSLVDATATAVGESVIAEPPASHAPLSGTAWLLSHWFQHVPEACTLFAWEIPKDTSTRV